MTIYRRHLAAVLLCVLCLNGCQEAIDPAVLKERDKYLLSEEPSGGIGVGEAREQITDQEQPIVLIGRVGAGQHSTWEPGKAAFVVRDPAAPLHASHHHADTPGHDPSTCKFCQEQAEKEPDMTALIRVVDDAGEVVEIDARKLLPIEEEQLVVIEGTAQVDKVGNLVVAAKGVYIRR